MKADIHNVGLRCGPYIDGKPVSGETQNAFEIRKCDEALLSAWVKLDLENEDTIDRTLASIAIRIDFPDKLGLATAPVLWNETRVVYHIIEDDKQTSQRWPWSAMLLAPGQRVPLEIDFRAFDRDNQIPFLEFKELIKVEPSPLDNTQIPVEFLGRFSGGKGWQVLGQCKIDISKDSIERKRTKSVIRSLTSSCV